MHSFLTTCLLLASTSTVSALLNVHNWCNQDVYVYVSTGGGCDRGPNSALCRFPVDNEPAGEPFKIGYLGLQSFDWVPNSGTSIKIAKNESFWDGELQFEYTYGGGNNFWDLSDLDGDGAASTGSPFYKSRVKTSPVVDPTVKYEGDMSTCVPVDCLPNQTCQQAYQSWNDTATRWCPEAVDSFWIDLCLPVDRPQKRAVPFLA